MSCPRTHYNVPSPGSNQDNERTNHEATAPYMWVTFIRLIISYVFFFLQSQSFTKKILRLVNRVGNNVDHTKELYEKPSVLKTRSLSMVLDRQVPSRIGDKALEYQGSKVTLPSTQELIGDDGKNKKYLSTQVRLSGTFSSLKCFEQVS